MDDDAAERQAGLEGRVARLEARLRRLEEAAALEAEARARAVRRVRSAERALAVERERTEASATTGTAAERQVGLLIPPPTDRSPEEPPTSPAEPQLAVSAGRGSSQAAWFDRQEPPEAVLEAIVERAEPEEPIETAWEGEPAIRLPSMLRLPDLSGSFEEIEARLAGRALAWVGGLALVLGAIFFLSLAFSRGWIGNEGRVLIGLVSGSVALGGGAAFMERGNRLLGHVLTPVGLAIITVSLVGATRLYDLVPVEVGLAVALLSAFLAALIAVRADSQVVAAFGLVSVLAAPPLLGADPEFATLGFIAIVLFATTGVALWRSWSWLPPTAFVLSAPQAAVWVGGDPDAFVGLAGMGLFWLLNIVAAGGEEFRRHRDNLSPSSATLLLANAAFFVWAGFMLLGGDLLVYQGFFLVLVALVQAGVGGFFIVRDGDRNLFGLLAIGTGIAALTMAAPVQFGAPVVPVAWSAEAVVLAWVAVRRGHPYSALVAAILYGMAGADILWLYREGVAPSAVPFADAPGGALWFFVASVALGTWLVRDRTLRTALAAFGLAVLGRCVLVVLDPPSIVIALSVLLVIGTATWRAIPHLPGDPIPWQVEGLIPRAVRAVGPWRATVDWLLPLVTTAIGILATVWLLALPLFGSRFGQHPTGVPFWHPAGAALGVYLVALVAVGWIASRRQLRERLAAVGLLAITWSCLPEFDGVPLIATWAAVMVGGFALRRGLELLPAEQAPAPTRPSQGLRRYIRALPFAAALPGLLAVVHALAVELPLQRFGRVVPPEIPFTDDGAVAALILAVAVLAAGAVVGGMPARRGSVLLAGAIVAYAIPFEVYAWAVVILWVGLGGLALVGAHVDRPGWQVFVAAAAVAVAGGAAVAGLIVAPPLRLAVGSTAIQPIVALQTAASLGVLALGLAGLGRSGTVLSSRAEPWTRWAWLAAGITVVYLLSVGVVDAVATQVGGSIATDELRTQGSVGLSVLWAALGVVTFVAGLRIRIADLRHGGLGLLGLSTAKVFLIDLSALDVAYRVISLIVLGLLLLASAWLWQRLQPRPPTAESESAGVTPPQSHGIFHRHGHA